MITYRKTLWGLHLLYRLYGSAVLRCTPFALLSGMMTALLFIFWENKDKDTWRHPYPYALGAFIVGFVVVFRSNFGYQRYWEGRSHLQDMAGRWADAYTLAFVFHNRGREASENPTEFRETLLHLMSLMHALALQHLRGDWDLHNLEFSHAGDLPPPVDAGELRYLLGSSTKRDGTWRMSLTDYFVLRGTDAKRAKYNKAMPLAVWGGVSAEEARLLGEALHVYGGVPRSTTAYANSAKRFSTPLFCLSTGKYIPGPGERVNVLYSWVQQLLLQHCMESERSMPAPMAVSLFRVLSEGLVSFENARKLADTPFPFPWAQAVLLMLLVFAFTAPLLFVAYVERLWLAVLLDVIAVQSYFVLNEVARDLEDPFIFEPNDLPLARMQYQFNERIKAASGSERPQYFWREDPRESHDSDPPPVPADELGNSSKVMSHHSDSLAADSMRSLEEDGLATAV